MRAIQVDDTTFQAISLAAAVSGLRPEEVVRRAVAALADGLSSSRQQPVDSDGEEPASVAASSTSRPRGGTVRFEEIPVFARYKGERVEGRFRPSDKELTVLSGALAGNRFSSPTAAAMAVVKAINPERERPETNGLLFWLLEDGRHLGAVRGV